MARPLNHENVSKVLRDSASIRTNSWSHSDNRPWTATQIKTQPQKVAAKAPAIATQNQTYSVEALDSFMASVTDPDMVQDCRELREGEFTMLGLGSSFV